jgi:tetratricopeptide (TPR) repeat protein
MSDVQAIAEAFRKLQAGDAAGALDAASRIIAAAPATPRAHLIAGLALRMLGRLDESRAALERSAALDPRDYAGAFELGMALELEGNATAALPQFERAFALRPAFLPARHALGLSLHRANRVAEAIDHLQVTAASAPQNADWQVDLAQALLDARRLEDAQPVLDRALAAQPDHAQALRHSGRIAVARGDFARAAQLFSAASAQDPDDEVLPIFIAQAELLLGHWDRGWAAYRRRETRRELEETLRARGRPTHVPALEELRGSDVTVLAEQGLGDILFFLRFAPALKAAARKLDFAGGERLHSLLERAGLFESLRTSADAFATAKTVVLTGDLPQVCRAAGEACPPSLRIAPDPARVGAWRQKLEAAGPRPWIGVTWRAGTPHAELAFGLQKTVPIPDLMKALKPLGGTVVVLQRNPGESELDNASRALGDKVHDFSRINDDLDDALAVVSLLDRHVGVSNTNMHLAAAAGTTADVLVPFPPEWRWGLGKDSPWFPGFRVLRQSREGDWSRALAALAPSASAGNTSRA